MVDTNYEQICAISAKITPPPFSPPPPRRKEQLQTAERFELCEVASDPGFLVSAAFEKNSFVLIRNRTQYIIGLRKG